MIGSSLASELATMRVTEQVDAIDVFGCGFCQLSFCAARVVRYDYDAVCGNLSFCCRGSVRCRDI